MHYLFAPFAGMELKADLTSCLLHFSTSMTSYVDHFFFVIRFCSTFLSVIFKRSLTVVISLASLKLLKHSCFIFSSPPSFLTIQSTKSSMLSSEANTLLSNQNSESLFYEYLKVNSCASTTLKLSECNLPSFLLISNLRMLKKGSKR